ncbi:diguanylate cyclase domain-containing protein [Motiliproteus sp.]|uniref:diguanylate cyclase domain-containing protein n=1 Tax=Motiliproteus sp. TaxID=1898955 RepID=UPI003BAB4281
MLGLILDSQRDAVFAVKERKIIYANRSAVKLAGYGLDELLERDFNLLVDPDEDPHLMALAQQRGRNQNREIQFDLIPKTGGPIPVATVLNHRFHDQLGHLFIASVHDLRLRRKLTKKIKRSEREFRQIIENLPDTFYRTDANGIITMLSPSSSRLLGYTPAEAIGTKLADYYYHPEDRDHVMQKLAANHGKPIQVDSALRHKSGHLVWVFSHLYARTDDDGNFIGVEGVTRESTKRKLDEERWIYAANHDFLTGLYNRNYFNAELERAMRRAKRKDDQLTLIYFDLDGFKSINDNHGHDAGDELLSSIAAQVKHYFRESDLIARIGGDEFAILFENELPPQSAREVAEQLVMLCRHPLEYHGRTLKVSASAGVARYPCHGDCPKTLLKSADNAMYQAKLAGKNRIALLN